MKPAILIGIGAPLMIAFAAPQPAAAQTAIPLPKFEQIELHGGGDVIVRHGPVQRVTLLEGSTRITEFKVLGRPRNERLVISACENDCPRRYRLRIEIVTPDVSGVAIHGGGEIVVQPGFPAQSNLAAAIHGGGEIDLRALPARSVAAAVHGGGSVLVRPQADLAAAVHGGGEIRYWGDPQLTSAVHGGGAVTRGD